VQAHAVVTEALHSRQREPPQRKRAVGERRPAADERGRDRQDQLVEQVGRQQLAGEVAAADEPGAPQPTRLDQPHQLG
jgi:hypothetical protein